MNNLIVDDQLFQWMKDIRAKIHRHPELAFTEFKTSSLIAQSLTELGIDYKTGIAKTGIVGRLIINKDYPTIALRADMDALPINEETELPFASVTCGIMHACGHDGHVAILLGAAAILKKNPPKCNVLFIFQPAEEGDGGALPMIEQGVLNGVDAIFGGHIDTRFQTGVIAIKQGVNSASTDTFEIEIKGRGGHCARPHETADVILIASQLVISLQSIISREIDPLQSAVISVGVFNAGDVHNAIAQKAVLKGSIRTTDPKIREKIKSRMNSHIKSLSNLYDIEISIRISEGYPPVINHDKAYEYARHTAIYMFGEKGYIEIKYPSLGGEDFAYFLEKVTGCFVRFGAQKSDIGYVDGHCGRFDFDEEVLRVGAMYFSELAHNYVNAL
ncbi:MAG: amidohydrolase [Nitrospirae bacterium]|nr:amidohydrolase [Nitrospirota bacterium]